VLEQGARELFGGPRDATGGPRAAAAPARSRGSALINAKEGVTLIVKAELPRRHETAPEAVWGDFEAMGAVIGAARRSRSGRRGSTEQWSRQGIRAHFSGSGERSCLAAEMQRRRYRVACFMARLCTTRPVALFACLAWACSSQPPARAAPPTVAANSGEQERTTSGTLPISDTARSLAPLFGIASLVVTGGLSVEQVYESGQEMRVRIGNTRLYIGIDGIQVPKAEAERVLGLVGKTVTAAFNVRTSIGNRSRSVVIGDASRLCLASEQDMRPLVGTRARLERDDLWFPDTLVRETGVWERFLRNLPTEVGADITKQMNELLLTDRLVLAYDILSWFSRTNCVELAPLPNLQFLEEDLLPNTDWTDARQLAWWVTAVAVGLRPRTLIRQKWQGAEGCRRLWMLLKLLEAVEPR